MVRVEQLAPGAVADLGRALGRADDVREHHGGKDALGRAGGARAGDELLELVHERVGVVEEDDALAARQLDEACAGHVVADELGVAAVDPVVALAAGDERGDADQREDVAHVGLADHAHRRLDRGRSDREPFHATEPLAEGGVTRVGGRGRVDRHALPPVLDAVRDVRLAPHRVVRPRVVGRGQDPRDRREQRQRAHALGVGGREQAGERRALGLRQHRRALAAGRVEHGEHVVHLLLERRRRHAVRHAAAAAVELDQARERRQTGEHPREPGLGPQVLHLRDPRVDQQDVVRPVAGDLVRERDVAVAGVARLQGPTP